MTTICTGNSRRSFLTRLGQAGVGAGAFLAAANSAHAQVTDVQLLNFALNLEYLSAEFYTVATSGQTIGQMGIAVNGTGTAGPTSGGGQITFIAGSSLALSAAQIAADERAHVRLLQASIVTGGGAPIAKPAINLDGLGTGFASQEQFVAAARALEDITVSAYVSLLPVLQSKANLSVLVRLLGDEAEHAANMRLHTALYNVTSKPVDAADIVAPPSGTQFISSDGNGLVTIRTPTQVLYYAFGMQANSTSGGFFPAGVNGTITASSAAATAS
jgi:hypothetical protein